MKILVGAVIGMSAGYGYHHLMIACKSSCINARFPLVPVVILGIVGAFAATRIK